MTSSPLIPEISLNPLPQSDGSCQYTCPTSRTTILTSVNGPLEVRPKDELPNHATIEVIVKPGIGVAGVRETRLSSLIHSTLQSLILTNHHPRTLIQIVAQIVQAEDHTSLPLLLTPLLNCTILSLLIAGIPMRTVGWSVHLAVLQNNSRGNFKTVEGQVFKLEEGTGGNDDKMDTEENEKAVAVVVRNPNSEILGLAKSSHTLTFSKEGEILLIESLECSQGSGGESADGQGWDITDFLKLAEEGKRICCEEGVEIVRDALGDRKVF
ncbi:exosome non-catalytic core subunit rrp46 [Orbilia oligospora]|uniref:Exosome non-catalytic core subunit rrp46 n=1 Tax=Orbilia oligospora TaxID=2813651 RepID=A0A6G1MNQ8_ORBOL|nr:exosome non-catalytic core subunit rrp46 [Orbilia oligospora]KAF3203130.1 exosome non-catalytic core subunit rrp46 [Orbilia oligospora]KAF3213331.1 exosome non-catalytic core subunit rrp46 [Orbilia oligospora]KAF3221315.1 exosome non-catalytic core subunit rrp46 [Orbilia oligospora]KAF3262543.1 exosome non-catalytic core subunit rrp46 [Orbilia oligospora]